MKNIFLFTFLFLFVFSCKKNTGEIHETASQKIEFQYITQIEMSENENSVFVRSGNQITEFSKRDLPLQSAMVIPTSALAFISELDLTDRITGISQPDFIYNPKIHSLLKEKKLEEIGTMNEIFVEKVLVSKPDIFVTMSSPALAKFHELLIEKGIKIIYIDEYEELNPLARAEYIKIFGKLFGQEDKAQEIFEEIEDNYQNIVKQVAEKKEKSPTIMANQIYGDTWYMPGGKSFQAKLFEDAGGQYLWADSDNQTSLNLSFESVFEKAKDADIWINAGDFPSLNALLNSYKNYEWFDAVKNKTVYSWNLRTSSTGANDYFETGVTRPDWVLKDLAAIFYPELFPEYKMYFYRQLK